MKLLVLLAMSLSISAVCGSGSRRSDNSNSNDAAAKERDTPFWAPRGKKTNLPDSPPCGIVRPFDEAEEEPTWIENDSSERFYDKNSQSDAWNARIKRSAAYLGLPSVDNEVRRRLWLLRSYVDPNTSKTISQKNLDFLSAWLKIAEKRKDKSSGNSNSNSNSNTDANNVPFWAARG